MSRSFRRKVDAEAWLADEVARANRGGWVDHRGGAVSFADWSAAWLDAKHDLAARTRFDYRELLDTRVLPTFGAVEIRRITPRMVRAWVAELAAEGLSSARIVKAVHLLRSSLEQAVADELLVRNPAARVKAPRSRRREQRFLTADQVTALAEAVDDHQVGSGLVVRWLAYTGMRWGETAALRRPSVDVLRRRVRITEAVSEIGGQLMAGATKTYEARTIVLPAFLADRVAVHLGEIAEDGLVFRSPTGGYLRGSNWRGRVWRPAVVNAGLDEGLRIHDLRHTAASLMISSGASIKAVQRQLGHATASMTLDLYGHLYDDDLDALGDALDLRYSEADAPARPS